MQIQRYKIEPICKIETPISKLFFLFFRVQGCLIICVSSALLQKQTLLKKEISWEKVKTQRKV